MPDHSTYRGIPIWFERGKTVFVWDGIEVVMPTQPMALQWIDEHMEEAGGDGYK